jgi:hypothetical protein
VLIYNVIFDRKAIILESRERDDGAGQCGGKITITLNQPQLPLSPASPPPAPSTFTMSTFLLSLQTPKSYKSSS